MKKENEKKEKENKHGCHCGGNCGCDHEHEEYNEELEECACDCDCEDDCECDGNCECIDSDAQEIIAELENNWKRALADYKNLQKRVMEERESDLRYLKASVIMRLLPILDNLEMLAKHSDDQGIILTAKEFLKILSEEGVTEIEAEGKEFDTKNMEAIELVDGPQNEVIEVTQKGYMLDNLVLRPTKVKVGRTEKE